MRRLIFTLFILVLIMWPDRHSNGQQSNAPGQVTSGYPIRRVVTGKNAEGKSAVIFDGLVPMLSGGGTQPWSHPVSTLWVTDSTPADNSGNRDAALGPTQSGPPPSSAFRMADFPVGMGPPSDPDAGLHKNKTMEYVVILSGEIDLRMGDGKEVHLKAGDTVVQRGGVHSWVNRGKQTCRAAVILIAAKD